MADDPSASQRRLVRWVIGGSAVSSLLLAAFVILWVMLPRWAPEFVVRWSPWLDPVIRVAIHDGSLDRGYDECLDGWGIGIIPALVRTLRSQVAMERKFALAGLVHFAKCDHLPIADYDHILSLVHDPDEGIRYWAIEVLSEFQHPGIYPVLLAMLRSADRSQRDTAIQFLQDRDGSVWDERVVAGVIAIAREPAAEVRQAAVKVLAGIDASAPRQELVAALDDPDGKVRGAATRAVAIPGLWQAVAPLSALMRVSKDRELRLQALRSLGCIKHASAVPALIESYADADAMIRSEAICSLTLIRDPRAVPVLIDAAADPDRLVRRSAVKGLESFTDERADVAILATMADADEAVAEAALAVAARKLLPGAESRLVADLTHPSEQRRLQAMEYLASRGGPKVFERLGVFRNHGEERVRCIVARGLGNSADPRAITALLEVLHDDDEEEVRAAAALAFARFSDPRIAEALISGIVEGRLRNSGQRTKTPDRDRVHFHNAVIDVIESQQLTADQRRRIPPRQVMPVVAHTGRGFSLFREPKRTMRFIPP